MRQQIKKAGKGMAPNPVAPIDTPATNAAACCTSERKRDYPTIAEALASAPSLPRLDCYVHPSGDVTVKIDRSAGIVHLIPSEACAFPQDVRQTPLTEEIDQTLAYTHANPDETLLWPYPCPAGYMQATCKHFYGDLWYKAGLCRKLTPAEAAYEIFQAKAYFEALPNDGRMRRGLHDGASIPRAYLRAAMPRRESKVAPVTSLGGVVLDFPYPGIVRRGDAVEYCVYSPQHEVRPGMLVLCATLPEDLDPSGAKVEPLWATEGLHDEDLLDGIDLWDRDDKVIPPSRYRVIGCSVAYTPKGGKTDECDQGIRFTPQTPGPAKIDNAHPLKWFREAGLWRLGAHYDTLTIEQQAKFVAVMLGREFFSRYDRPQIKTGIVPGSLPGWFPNAEEIASLSVEISRDIPQPGEAFYAIWRSGGDETLDTTGFAFILRDGRTAVCGDQYVPIDQVRILARITGTAFKESERPVCVSLDRIEATTDCLKVAA